MARAHEYHRPESIGQALGLLSQNPQAVAAAGGTPMRTCSEQGAEIVIDLSALSLAYVRAGGGHPRIGAMTRLEQLSAAPAARAFADGLIANAAKSACASALRSHRTLGGSILSTDPEGEICAALLVLDAEILLQAAGGPAEYRFSDVMGSNCPNKDAIVTEARLREPVGSARVVRERIARTPSDRAIVSVVSIAAVQNGVIREIRLAASGAGLRAVRLRDLELRLAGAVLRPDAIRPVIHDAMESLEIADHRLAGAEYCRAMIEVLITRALQEPSARGSASPENGR